MAPDATLPPVCLTPAIYGDYPPASALAPTGLQWNDLAHRTAPVQVIAGRLRERTAAAWLDALDHPDVPCAPVRSVMNAVADPVLRERGALWTLTGSGFGQVAAVGSPVRMERTPPVPRRSPPRHGKHTREVRERGWS